MKVHHENKQYWRVQPRKSAERFVNIDLFCTSGLQSKDLDGVHEYDRETLSLSLLHTEFQDAIRVGDGLRMLRVWILVFKYHIK